MLLARNFSVNINHVSPDQTTAKPKKLQRVSALAAILLAICAISLLSPDQVHASDDLNTITLPITIGGHTYQHYIQTIVNGSSTVYLIQDEAGTPTATGTWPTYGSRVTAQGHIGSTPNSGSTNWNVQSNYFDSAEGNHVGDWACTGTSFTDCTGGYHGSGEFFKSLCPADGVEYLKSDLDIEDYFGGCDYSAGAGAYIPSAPPSFLVGQDNFLSTSSQFIMGTLGTSTLVSTTNFLSFLNVPRLLATKVPFGYFFLARDAISSAISTTSIELAPVGTISFKLGKNLATSTVTLFSTSTLGYFMPASTVAYLRGILLMLLYAEFIYFMYHAAIKIKL